MIAVIWFRRFIPFFALIAFSLSAHADDATDSKELSVEAQLEIIAALKTLIEDEYVLEDKAETLSLGLSTAVTSGQYQKPMALQLFAEITNTTLQHSFPDRHLKLLTPEKYQNVMEMFGSSHGDRSDSAPGHVQHSRGGADASANHETRKAREQKGMEALRQIAGITRVSEISRDGVNQIGYLAFERLIDSDRSRKIIDSIFHTFSDSERMIIDLRDCRGGDAGIVKLISNYFFEQPTHLVSSETRNGAIEERWTQPNQLSDIFARKKLDILVSAQTFSAGESFAFGMQKTGRARIIGNATGGGGHMNDFFPLPSDFGASISIGRTFDPRTGDGWQARGVVPDLVFQNDHALSETLKLITAESGKLAAFSDAQLQVYEILQDYTHAWYNADADTMGRLISSDFEARYSSASNSVTRNHDQQLAATGEGEGSLRKLFHNRIIRKITIDADLAFAELILRETSHKIRLMQSDGEWKIQRDDYGDKTSHG